MAMICDKCGGIIPDIMPLGKDRSDCKHYQKQNYEFPYQGDD